MDAAIIYGVDEVNNLVTFDSAAPGTTLSSVALQLSGASVIAMDIRVSTGVLYALTDDLRLVTVDRTTGVTNLVATLTMTGTQFAFDFNPVNTNLRIVSNDNTNYIRNFTTNTLVPGTTAAYGVGDPNNGNDPDVAGAGYTNNDTDVGTGTTLFVLDSQNDVLATMGPATGILTTVGALGVNVGPRVSFDISSLTGGNEGFVIDGSVLYSINLATGALTSLGNTDRALFAMAVSDVPEPATWAMMLMGGALAGFSRRKR